MARILIIDDSPTEIVAFSRLLENHGYECLSADNAEEGLTVAQQESPDLILMDVVMPGMNGFQATRRLSRNPATSQIPVIMISTKDQETDRIWGLRQGAKEYVVKPPDQTELLGKIKTVLAQRWAQG
ncbi:MAG: response regulator [Phycisphaerae bacterium]|nr:response regulator [Phycisphaerae bacterium]